MKPRVALFAAVIGFAMSLTQAKADVPGEGKGLPDELGKHNVGHTKITITTKGSLNEVRPIDVDIWYPADKEAWNNGSASRYSSQLYGVTLIPSKWDPLSWFVASDVAREGVAFDKHGPFPVIIFSPGSLTGAIEYARTLELVASHGYVVAGMTHNGDSPDDLRVQTLTTSNGNKQVLDCPDHLAAPCVDTTAKSVLDRSHDLSVVLDTLPVAFPGQVDMDRVIGMGHSRGTVTMLGAAGGSAFFHFGSEPRVKGVIGFAAGAPAVIFNIDLKNVVVPTVLVAGEIDRNTPSTTSEQAYGTIISQDKAFIVVNKAEHRHFGSSFCDATQASGATAIVNPTRRILDTDTLRRRLIGGVGGDAVNLCGYGTFTDPEDIRPLVLSLTGFNVTQTNVPGDGIDVAEVHRLMSAISVTFFNAVNKALRHQDEVDDDGNVCPGGYCVPDVRFKKYLSPKWILKKEVNILSEVVLTGEDMKALDCRAGEEGCED